MSISDVKERLIMDDLDGRIQIDGIHVGEKGVHFLR